MQSQSVLKIDAKKLFHRIDDTKSTMINGCLTRMDAYVDNDLYLPFIFKHDTYPNTIFIALVDILSDSRIC